MVSTLSRTVLAALLVVASAKASRVDSALVHIYEEMDRFNKTFDIYTDADAGGNHYSASQWMNGYAIGMDPFSVPGAGSSITCIRCEYLADSAAWAGVGWVESPGYDLTGADSFWFSARGASGGEAVEFGIGGPDDSIYRFVNLTLGDTWGRYAIDASGGILRDLNRAFYWVASRANNPAGCTFFVDDMQYDLARPDSLRFVQTYVPVLYPHDREWALNQAYTYPNALAMLALMTRGSEEDMRRARILGDAFATCQGKDRHFDDGRLRNAYMTGDIIDRTTGKARLPGWWDPDSGRWFEDNYQVGSYTGEMAWLLMAWLTHDSIAGTNRYLLHALELGKWIQDSCWSGSAAGYDGGYAGPDPGPRLPWFSVEHNLDVYVAFTRLAAATGDTLWRTRADSALAFVHRMWDPLRGYFNCGLSDSVTLDTLCVLDAQTWGLLATRDSAYFDAISAAESLCRRTESSHGGYCFSQLGDGLWWEGTAQASCAHLLAGQAAKYDTFVAELDWCQDSAPHGNGKGIVACLPESSYTGMDRFWGKWYYYARLDIAATAWFIFAQGQWNPFWFETVPPVGVVDDSGKSGVRDSPYPSVVRDVLYVPLSWHRVPAALVDASGRRVQDLVVGENDVRRLAAGVYFVRAASPTACGELPVVTKVIVAR